MALSEAEEIEERMRNLEKNRDAELARLQKEVEGKRAIMEKAVDIVEKHQGKFEGLQLEIDELDNECTAAKEELKTAEEKSATLSAALEHKINICNEGMFF